MIIIRHLLQETLKSQLAIFLVLLFVFLCQKLVKILDLAVNCELPSNLVISLLTFGIPETTQLILPLSLFLGILVTLSKFHATGVITVMYACGLSKAVLIKIGMILALITGMITIINVAWISPLSSQFQYKLLTNIKTKSDINSLAKRKFQKIDDSNSILFIDGIKKNHFNNAFLAQLHSEKNSKPSVMVANSGSLTKRVDGSQVLTLNYGIRFEETEKLRDFRITNFQNYQVVIDRKITKLNQNNTEQMNIRALLNNRNNYAYAELHWRLTLVFTVFIMALMAIPLSSFNARKGGILSIIPAILFYLVFFLLQGAIRSNGSKGKLNSALWAWLVNSFYILLAILLNTWNTMISRRIRALVTEKRKWRQ